MKKGTFQSFRACTRFIVLTLYSFLYSYEVSWRYSNRLLSYRVYKPFEKIIKGALLGSQERGTTILACDTLSLPNTNSYKIEWKYHEEWVSIGLYKNVNYKKICIKQRAISLKQRNGKQTLLYATYRLDLIHAHVLILLSFIKISQTVTELQVIHDLLDKNHQRGITWKLRKGEQPFLSANIVFT